MSRFIAGVVRRLRKRFGKDNIVLKNETAANRNLSTGVFTRQFETATVRALLLPVSLKRDFAYDLAFIAANNNFTYGGLYETEDVDVIIDAATLPTAFTIEKDTIVNINDRAYTIVKISREWSAGAFYALRVHRVEDNALGKTSISPSASSAVASNGA